MATPEHPGYDERHDRGNRAFLGFAGMVAVAPLVAKIGIPPIAEFGIDAAAGYGIYKLAAVARNLFHTSQQ